MAALTMERSIVDLRARVVELGKIKIGKKGAERTSQSGTKYRVPEKLDHFTVTTLDRDAAGDFKPDLDLMNRLAAASNCKPDAIKELPIALMSDEIEEVFPTSYVYYAASRCIARSDGNIIEWICDPKTLAPLPESRFKENERQYVQTATVGEGNKKTRMFKPHGTLNCLITAEGARWGGVYKLRTTSIITIKQLVSGLAHVKQLTRGFLRNVPLRLVMRPMQVSPDGIATTVYVCHVEIRGADLITVQQNVIEAARVEIATDRQLQGVRREYLALLSAPGENESDEDQEDVNAEFAPETATIDAEFVAVPATAAAPAPVVVSLTDRIAAARTEDDFKALGAEVNAGDDAAKGAYYAARQQHLNKPVPATHTAKPRRTPPAPPVRAAAPAPVPAQANGAITNPDDIPF